MVLAFEPSSDPIMKLLLLGRPAVEPLDVVPAAANFRLVPLP